VFGSTGMTELKDWHERRCDGDCPESMPSWDDDDTYYCARYCDNVRAYDLCKFADIANEARAPLLEQIGDLERRILMLGGEL
jgi:hypothetical protein